MATIADCLRTAGELQEISGSARLDVELLLAKALGKPRSYLYTWPDRSISPYELEQFTRLLEQRKRGEPLAYLLGEKEFWSLPLKVTSWTLIPRPETELLVELGLSLFPNEPRRILDLGTGTGAIALALASERPAWKILAVDDSPQAVQLAIENCRSHGFTNVEITRSDWFANVAQEQFDLIVANPPYIDPADRHLTEGDVRFEPHSALVAGDQGLADIKRIISDAREFLRPRGWLLLEHGYDQADQVRGLFAAAGYHNIDTRQDLAGKDRLSLGQFE